MMKASAVLAYLKSVTPKMLDELAILVESESPSSDLVALNNCAERVARLGDELFGERPKWHDVDGHPHLLWQFGPSIKVLVIGHIDTVWPIDTVARWPFAIKGDSATGPGVFDMKAGVVCGLFSLAALENLDGVAILLNSDEEIGSPTSKPIIERLARDADAALVLEGGLPGGVKTARKGISNYQIQLIGKAAHAGQEPEKGVNALVELSHQVIQMEQIARPSVGTTIVPSVALAGTTVNTVPAAASFHINVRATSVEEQQRVDCEIRKLHPVVPGSVIKVTGSLSCPPMPPSSSAALFSRAKVLAKEVGIDDLQAFSVGGASDANTTANMGIASLDGLGPVGGPPHAEGERIEISSMAERGSLFALLVDSLLSEPPRV